MQCAVITAATPDAVQTAVNEWLNAQNNSGEGLEIKYVAMTEGTIGSSTIKVIIFYDSEWSKLAPS